MKDADHVRLLRAVAGQFQADTGTLHLIDPQDGLLHLRATVGRISGKLRGIIRVIPVGRGIAGQAAKSRKPVSICDIKTDKTRVVRPGAKTMGIEAALCVPVIADGAVIGTLGIGRRSGRAFTRAEESALIEAAQGFAKSAKAKIERPPS
jgi:L-methionine (R)-S-oxide reductase